MPFIDDVNFDYYENHFSSGTTHIVPNVNTIRCEIWYFRKNREPGKILDYGFGYGQELIYFADRGYDVYGLDIVPSAKSRFDDFLGEHRPELADKITTELIDRDASRLPFDDHSFDFIHSNQVIYHLPSEEAITGLLSEWHRILKPGGLLMFSAVGPQNTLVTEGTKVGKELYECEYETPSSGEKVKIRSYVMKDEAHIRSLCNMFKVDEVGWFTNHYAGVDGFHWQVLAKK